MKPVHAASVLLALAVAAAAGGGCVTLDPEAELATSELPVLRPGPAQTLVAGSLHACALLRDGAVRCWGSSSQGQVGVTVGGVWPSPFGVELPGPAIALGASSAGTCAVLADSSVRCWGHNGFGQVMPGGPSAISTPTAIPGIDSARAVASSITASCALLAGGTVSCWGGNSFGVLGRGAGPGIGYLPAPVIQQSGVPLSGIRQLSAGAYHVCAVDSSGREWCWGYNSVGQIDASKTSYPHAVQVATGVLAVSAADNGTCHTLVDQTICRGSAPSTTTGVLVDVHLGSSSACGIGASGVARCWGSSSSGQLGNGTTTATTSLVSVSYSNNETTTAVGTNFACAQRVDGSVRCWGANLYGQLGNGGTSSYSGTPVTVVGLRAAHGWQVSSGDYHDCALSTHGQVRCRGLNLFGQLGDGTYATALVPSVPVNLLTDALDVSAGGGHACAVRSSGAVSCWGNNASGQLGDGTTDGRAVAGTVYTSGGMVAVTAGNNHTCALRASGRVACWGLNGEGQLGRGSIGGHGPYLLDVPGLAGIVAVDAGARHTCALSAAGRVYCWGGNSSGQLGNGTTTVSPSPTLVAGVTGAVAISSGGSTSCALLGDGTARCWGGNGAGQLGDGSITNRPSPIGVGNLTGAIAIATGGGHTCALVATGLARCWGSNRYGQLGLGDTTNRTTPAAVAGGDHFVDLSAGGAQTCATRADGTVACWGFIGRADSGGYPVAGQSWQSLTPTTIAF